MTNNEKIESLRVLAEQMRAAKSVMQESDGRASKCVKLGLDFAQTYPTDASRYEAAREAYNRYEAEYDRISAIIPEEEPREEQE